MRWVFLLILLGVAPCRADDLPDPGRRLTPEEQRTDPDKRTHEKQSGPFDPSPVPQRNAQACEGARRNYQMSCKAVGTFASHSQACAEAYAHYRMNCP